MNKKSIINFIKLTNPVGEYFEELGGIYCGMDYIQQNILILAKEKYYKEFLLTFDNYYIHQCYNENNDILKYIRNLNINNYTDYTVPNYVNVAIIRQVIEFNENNLVMLSTSDYCNYCSKTNYYTEYPCKMGNYYTVIPIRWEPMG